MAGHNVTLVCLPSEADIINAEGTRIRLPVRNGSQVEIASRDLPGRISAATTSQVDPSDFDLVGLAMQDRNMAPGRSRTARRDGACESAVHVDHEHAAASLSEAHSGPRRVEAEALLHRCQRVGELRSRAADLVQPRSAGLPSARRKAERLQVTLPTNFKVARFDSDAHTAMLRRMQADIEAIRFETSDGPIELRSSSRSTIRCSYRWPSGHAAHR